MMYLLRIAEALELFLTIICLFTQLFTHSWQGRVAPLLFTNSVWVI